MAAPESSHPTTVELSIDGRQVVVSRGTTIWKAARQLGIDIPALCHDPGMRPVGVCRVCVVDVGERVLAASCVRECADGMIVHTASAKVEKQRAMLLRLLLSDYPEPQQREPSFQDCQLEQLAEQYALAIAAASGASSASVATAQAA